MRKTLKAVLITCGVAVFLAIVLAALILLPKSTSDETEKNQINLTLGVDENGIHTAQVETNEKGEIENNGSGTLLDYDITKIRQIDIKNQSEKYTIVSKTVKKGNTDLNQSENSLNEDSGFGSTSAEKSKSETVETKTVESETAETKSPEIETTYSLVNYENFKLQSGVADSIAENAAKISFTKVAKINCESLADYGLENPRVAAKIIYSDDTTSLVYIGNNAPNGLGVYVSFGTDNKTVYLFDSEAVDGFLKSKLELFSLQVNETPTGEGNTSPSKVTLSGSAFSQDIVLKTNNDEEIPSSYVISSHNNIYASDTTALRLTETIRGLYAQSVVCVNPSEKQMIEYGLKTPYAIVEGVYKDAVIKLFASKPNDDGTVFLTDENKLLVYQIASSSVVWVNTTYQDLVNEKLFSPDFNYLSAVSIAYSDKEYKFEITSNSESQEETNSKNTETDLAKTQSKKITCNGKTIDADSFEKFYENLTSYENIGKISALSSNLQLTVKYSYITGRDDDILRFYNTKNQKLAVTFNGKELGLTYNSVISKIKTGVSSLIK